MSNYSNHGNEGQASESVHHGHNTSGHGPSGNGPYWKRAHHDFRFWIGLILMLTAITIYVLSDDLAFLPHHRGAQQPVSSAGGK
jgi:hypothetical protein